MAADLNFDGLMHWRCIGPFRGGRVVAVAGSYSDPNTFYFGAVGGGVWKTIDAGAYWRPITDGFLNTSAVGALAVAPSDSEVIYAGTGETTIRIDVSHGDGAYRSRDAGRTWKHVGLKESRFIGKIRVHPQDPDTLWVAALGHAFGLNRERGVYKSSDGGENWSHVLFVSDKAGAVDLSLDANPRTLYAAIWEGSRSFSMLNSGGEESGLWRSQDGGETWQAISANRGLPKGILGKIGVAASPARSGRVWALIEHTTEGGLYRSDDFGDTWERVSDNQNLISRAWYYMHLTADPQDAETVYVNNLSFFRSTDGGHNFTQIATPHGDNHDLWIDPANNQRMIQGNDGGGNVSLNGAFTFSTIYNQPTAQFYHLTTDNREPYYVYGTQQDNSSIAVPSHVNYPAIRWADCFIAGTGESGYIAVDPKDDDIVYVGAIGSSPGGGNSLQRFDRKRNQIRLITTWPEYDSGVGASDYKFRFAWTYPIHFSPHDDSTIYVGGNMVFKTTNEGQTWTPISPDLTRADPETLKPTGGPVNLDAIGAETYATVFAFAESPVKAGLLWAGSDDGLIHVSKNNGEKWTNVTPKSLPEWMMISCIEPSPVDAGTAYLAGTRYKLDDYQPYLYVTRDYGKTWKRITSGIPADDFTRVIRIDPAVKGLLYAGTETGVYVSMDDGGSWQRMQLNLPVSPVHELLVKGSDLIAGTHGRSIWILDDLTPIRTLASGGAGGKNAFLFPPRQTVRYLPGVDWNEDIAGSTNYTGGLGGAFLTETTTDGLKLRTYLDAGENSPGGVIVTYRLAKQPDEPLSLSFSNEKGDELISFSSRKEDDKPVAEELRAPAAKGWNRFVWKMQIAPATKIEGSDPPAKGPIPGPVVAPGKYSVTLKSGSKELRQDFAIVKPAVVDASQADLDAQFSLLQRIHRQTDRTVISINQMRDVRAQFDGLAKRAGKKASNASIAAEANELRDNVLDIEKKLLVPDLRDGWADRLNQGTRLFDKLVSLPPVVALGDYRPTDAAEAAFTDLAQRIESEIEKFERLVDGDIRVFNATAAKAKLPTVIV